MVEAGIARRPPGGLLDDEVLRDRVDLGSGGSRRRRRRRDWSRRADVCRSGRDAEGTNRCQGSLGEIYRGRGIQKDDFAEEVLAFRGTLPFSTLRSRMGSAVELGR